MLPILLPMLPHSSSAAKGKKVNLMVDWSANNK